MKTLTFKDFDQFNPCYSPTDKYGEWEGTILDLMNRPDIPDKDKVWAFTQEGMVSDKTLRLFAVACAREVQHLMTDQRSIAALDVAERYAHGDATKEELRTARAAAREAAAWEAAGAADAAREAEGAARAAAWEAWVAAREAGEAGREAAWAAGAGGAAGEARAARAARAAVWEKQVQMAVGLINKYEL